MRSENTGFKVMKTSRLHRLQELLQAAVDTESLPGAVVAVGIGQEIVYEQALGFAERLHGVIRPMTLDTLFDLASLTKVVATLPSILLLVEQGELRLSDPVTHFIPTFTGAEKEGVTLYHLLTHSSGLPAHREFYRQWSQRDEILAAVIAEPLETSPGARVVYSDLGFILLGEIVQRVTGQTLDVYARHEVFEPLGMVHTQFCPPGELASRIAATEDVPERGVKVGVVHDENAEASGGVSGHAGLFAPARDLIRYLQMWLGLSESDDSVLSASARHLAVQPHMRATNTARGLGWVLRGDVYDHMGDLWPQSGAGHTGFTGTSLAFDPASGLWTVLLTNCVHYGRENQPMRRLRPLIHNVVAATLLR
jgi:CubicO group peptidase (beta-lactamase class C family)